MQRVRTRRKRRRIVASTVIQEPVRPVRATATAEQRRAKGATGLVRGRPQTDAATEPNWKPEWRATPHRSRLNQRRYWAARRPTYAAAKARNRRCRVVLSTEPKNWTALRPHRPP